MTEQQNTDKENQKKPSINTRSVNFSLSGNKCNVTSDIVYLLPMDKSLYEPEFKNQFFNNVIDSKQEIESYTPDKCPLCEEKMNRYDICSLEEYNLYSCVECGSLLFDPPITRNIIDNFYSYLDPEIVHHPAYKRLIEKYKKLFRKIFPRSKGKTLLNVDSRLGYATEAAKSLEFKTIKGIDRYDFYTDFQKNNFGEKFFETKTIEEYISQDGEPADVVLSIESLCFQPNIDEYISNLAKVTKKGGTLYIEEVDGNSIFLPSDLSRWFYIQPPIKCNFISKEALYILLKKHGFKVRKKLFNFNYKMRVIARKL